MLQFCKIPDCAKAFQFQVPDLKCSLQVQVQ
jgi:hypothetical protein